MKRLIGLPLRLTAAVLCLMIAPVATNAYAMSVQPVAVDLQMAGREMSAPVRVENNGVNPLPVEIRIVETDFGDDGVKASSRRSEDILAFPPQAIIPPGQTQVFRLQYVGDTQADHSKHYYAEVAQLPVELPEGQSAIQILYNFQVMVNVASLTAGKPELAVTKAEVATNPEGKSVAAFTVHNASQNYGYLNSHNLTVTQKDAAGKQVARKSLSSSDVQQMIGFGLVGPGLTRRFLTPVEVNKDSVVEVSLTKSRGR